MISKILSLREEVCTFVYIKVFRLIYFYGHHLHWWPFRPRNCILQIKVYPALFFSLLRRRRTPKSPCRTWLKRSSVEVVVVALLVRWRCPSLHDIREVGVVDLGWGRGGESLLVKQRMVVVVGIFFPHMVQSLFLIKVVLFLDQEAFFFRCPFFCS